MTRAPGSDLTQVDLQHQVLAKVLLRAVTNLDGTPVDIVVERPTQILEVIAEHLDILADGADLPTEQGVGVALAASVLRMIAVRLRADQRAAEKQRVERDSP